MDSSDLGIDLDHLRDVPGFKAIVRAVLKKQMKYLVEQLSELGAEETMVLSASLSDGLFHHLGSSATEGFLDSHDTLKYQFLGHCLKGVQQGQKSEVHDENTYSALNKSMDSSSRSAMSRKSKKTSLESAVTPVFLTKVMETTSENHVKNTVGSKAGSHVSDVSSPKRRRKGHKGHSASMTPVKPMLISETVDQAIKALSAESGQDIEEIAGGFVKVESDSLDKNPTKTEDSNTSDTMSLDLDQSTGAGMKDAPKDDEAIDVSNQIASEFAVDNIVQIKIEPADSEDVGDFEQGAGQLDLDQSLAAANSGNEPVAKIDASTTMDPPGVCRYCGKFYHSKSGLNNHERVHQGKAPYSCCGKLYYSKANYTRHKCSEHGFPKDYKCGKCGKEFATNADLHRHTKEKLFKCELCDLKFQAKSKLTEHINRHTDSLLSNHPVGAQVEHVTPIVDSDGPSSMSKREEDSATNRVKALEPFSEPQESELLEITKQITKQYECIICGFGTNRRYNFQRHLKVHSEATTSSEEKVVCTQCGKQYQTLSGLIRHVKKEHTKATKYKCAICKKLFHDKRHFQGHMGSHMDQKSNICTSCNQAFQYRSGLLRHQKTCGQSKHAHDKSRSFICEICGGMFLRKDILKDHKRCKHRQQQTYSCSFCSAKFFWRSSVAKHISAKHHGALKQENEQDAK